MNNHHRKTAPIHPMQLTTGRVKCEECPAEVAETEDKNICKCAGCGIGTEDFIQGSLIELYVKHPDYPVVLIENVYCPSIEHSAAFQKAASQAIAEGDFVSFEPNASKDYYLGRDENDSIRIYHIFDLSKYYELCPKGCCIQRRKDDPIFKEGCTQCDLRTASDIMYGRADSLDKYKKVTYSGIETPAYAYYCNRNDCPLVELAFPIKIDGLCVAVLLIGQIDPKSTDDLETLMEEHKTEAETITRDADEFSKRMQERAHLRKSDYFYRLLSKQYDHLSEHLREANSIGVAIEKIYQDIMETFDCRELTVLYTNSEERAGFSLISFPKEEAGKYSFTTKELLAAVRDDGEDKLHKLFMTGGDETVNFYRQPSPAGGSRDTLDCFILTVVRWKRKETKGIENFFDALNARLFSLLMTKLAQEKKQEADDQKTNQAILIESFSHDLNQKLEIVGNHTRLLDIKKESWGISPDNKVFSDIKDYVKDIHSLEMQLRHFTREVSENNSGLPVAKNEQVFKPYGQFLFNLAEYYDSLDSVRRLLIPTMSNVTLFASRYPFMRADPVLIERCVNNLLSNAFKYSYRYTNIYLDCYRKGKDYCIEVTSFSSPIRPDVKDSMFDFGVSQSVLRHYRQQKGKGIGLATVQRICELHSGTVECFSDERISDYNVPVLYRLMQELSDARRADTLDKKLADLKIEHNTYDSILTEYSRLLNQRVREEKNHVAYMFGVKKQISEICYPSPNYTEKLTAPFLRMALRTPTVRVVFRITIPQE